ncbi:MAG: DapH/DapD/GlmU-related protein [Eubacteriales bacterium]|nr:DapH/DapD/GlmU-related protein [Eubacteriales bacterium]
MSCAGHPFNIEERRDDLEYAYPITIGDDVWIGEGCKILPGVTVGSGSVIAAGSVVAYDIPEGVLAAGQPARPVKRISGFKSEE